MAVTRMKEECSIRAHAARPGHPVRLRPHAVDFQRTQEALHAAYEQIRARIEAVAYMEVPELLDLVERVAGGVDRLVAESYEQRRMEEVAQAEMFRQALSG